MLFLIKVLVLTANFKTLVAANIEASVPEEERYVSLGSRDMSSFFTQVITLVIAELFFYL